MKVRCTKLLNPEGSPQLSSKWLTLGAFYDVLTVEIDRTGMRLVRLLGDRGIEVALFPIDAFEVVGRKLPETWAATWTEDGFFQLGPEAWLDSQFWERFYDRDPAALQTFDVELEAIKRCNEL